jgi:hypothetical protein
MSESDDTRMLKFLASEIAEAAGWKSKSPVYAAAHVRALILNLKTELEVETKLRRIDTTELRRQLKEAKLKHECDRIALENAIDASKEGAWMARALDAERELGLLKKHLDESWQECHDGSESACSKSHE